MHINPNPWVHYNIVHHAQKAKSPNKLHPKLKEIENLNPKLSTF
jgi:hypothetical protein